MVEAARLVRSWPDAYGASLWHAKGTMHLLPRRVCRPGGVAGSLKHLAARRAMRARVSRQAEGLLSGAALQAQVEYCDSDSDTVTIEAIDPWARQKSQCHSLARCEFLTDVSLPVSLSLTRSYPGFQAPDVW
jgi:hypothetical protein